MWGGGGGAGLVATATRPPLKLWSLVASIQALYFGVTGVWPLLHMRSFLAVTGPKTDLWLVRVVGGLITVVAFVLADSAWRSDHNRATALVGLGAAVVLLAADVLGVGSGAISPVYLWDAAAEATLIVAWCVALARRG